jgi:hypothetical protein
VGFCAIAGIFSENKSRIRKDIPRACFPGAGESLWEKPFRQKEASLGENRPEAFKPA